MPGRAYHVASARVLRQRRMAVVRAKVREIFMLALSSTMTEGKVISWMAAEGDRVAKGDPVVVVKSDKADMDVETFYDRIITAVIVPAGGTAPSAPLSPSSPNPRRRSPSHRRVPRPSPKLQAKKPLLPMPPPRLHLPGLLLLLRGGEVMVKSQEKLTVKLEKHDKHMSEIFMWIKPNLLFEGERKAFVSLTALKGMEQLLGQRK